MAGLFPSYVKEEGYSVGIFGSSMDFLGVRIQVGVLILSSIVFLVMFCLSFYLFAIEIFLLIWRRSAPVHLPCWSLVKADFSV